MCSGLICSLSRIDAGGVIKVADFGLSERLYTKTYFREGGEEVKLPVKWMAMRDCIFNEKTDLVRLAKSSYFVLHNIINVSTNQLLVQLNASLQWSFGVTCWEVFALGSMPYAGVNPFAVMRYLQEGQRLEKPMNAACSDQVSVIVYLYKGFCNRCLGEM